MFDQKLDALDYSKPPLMIGLVGLAGSGKDTVGLILQGEWEHPDGPKAPQRRMARTYAFADVMKEIIQRVYPEMKWQQLYGPSQARETPTPYTRPNGAPLTARYALQRLGDFGRDCDRDTWVNMTLAAASKAVQATPQISLIIFTDVRFINEARRLKETGAVLWRIRRPAKEPKPRRWWQFWRPKPHVSEAAILSTEMDALVDREITNDSTLPALRNTVRVALVGAEVMRDCRA